VHFAAATDMAGASNSRPAVCTAVLGKGAHGGNRLFPPCERDGGLKGRRERMRRVGLEPTRSEGAAHFECAP
jgi:hypothetical protein